MDPRESLNIQFLKNRWIFVKMDSHSGNILKHREKTGKSLIQEYA
jgi:hypothetical protein